VNLTLLIIGLAIALSLIMTVAWAVVVRTGQSGWIDAIWSFAVGIAGVVGALYPLDDGAWTVRQLLAALLVAFWSLRLGLHIAGRTLRGGDDPRYAWLRQEWGDQYRRQLLLFLQIQAACALVLVVAVIAAARNPEPMLRLGDGLGVLLLVIAVLGEGASDRQLERFRADPANRGRVCDTGLWGRSRHPNYFFEVLGWFAYAAIALDPTGGYGLGWVAFAGPALMYWLLVYVSGVPPLEAHMLRARGDAFRAYQARVNTFWPSLRPAPSSHS